MSRIRLFALLLLALAASVGCGAGQARLKNDLKATGLAYHSYHDEHKVGPPGWDELIEFANKQNLFPDGIGRVRDAKYEMKWNVKLGEITGGTGNVVLGKPPAGGPTLMLDGTVR